MQGGDSRVHVSHSWTIIPSLIPMVPQDASKSFARPTAENPLKDHPYGGENARLLRRPPHASRISGVVCALRLTAAT